MNRRRFIAVAAAALAAGPAHARADTVRWRGVALGAEAEITLRGPKRAAEQALKDALGALETAERLFSLYDPASALSRLNEAGRITPPAPMAALLALCDDLHRVTAGRFDPTVQPLWRALATGGDVAAARAAIGWNRVKIDADVRLAPGQALTLNGIAQGFATDMVSEALEAAGFAETLVNIGEFRAGDGEWRIGVEDPVAGSIRTARLTRSAVATSSPVAMTVGGASHILGPAGEAPRWSTISVEANAAALADGLSTALCLAPAPAIEHIALAMPGVIRVTMVDAEGDIRVLTA